MSTSISIDLDHDPDNPTWKYSRHASPGWGGVNYHGTLRPECGAYAAWRISATTPEPLEELARQLNAAAAELRTQNSTAAEMVANEMNTLAQAPEAVAS